MSSDKISAVQFNAAAKLLGKNLEWKDANENGQQDEGELFVSGKSLAKIAGAEIKGNLYAIQNRAKNLLVFPVSRLEPESVYELDASKKVTADPKKLVDNERLAARLMEALGKPSKSCEEAEFAKYVQAAFTKLGVKLDMDDLQKKVAALPEKERADYYCNEGKTAPNSGDLIGFAPATDPSLPTWNLSFHLDTLQTSFEGFKREGDTIKPAPGTPLGADDKIGYAVIAEVVRILQENKIPHGRINIVALVGEEDTAGGAQLIAASAFSGDALVSIDGTKSNEIGRAAPTMYKATVEIRTQTSHPASFDIMKSVSACALAAKIKSKYFEPSGHPFGNPNVVFHSFFESCGDEFSVDKEGKKITQKTEFGIPMAYPKNNTVSPYATFVAQMRNLEGTEKAAEFVAGFKKSVADTCAEASKGRTPVQCTVTGMDKPGLVGYAVAADNATIGLLVSGFKAAGVDPEVSAKQFGSFNGNFIFSRPDLGKQMLITGTGANELIHTTDETASVKGMGEVAKGLLASMLESYKYKRVEVKK